MRRSFEKKEKKRKTGEAAEENKRKLSKAPALQLKPCKGWKLLIFRAKKKKITCIPGCVLAVFSDMDIIIIFFFFFGLTLNLFFRSKFANFGLKKLCIFFGHHFYCLCVFSTRMMASLCVFSHVTLWPQKQQASGSHQLTNRPFVSCTFYMHLHPSAVVLQCDQEPSVLFTFYRSALFQSRSTSLSGHTIGQQKPHGQNI